MWPIEHYLARLKSYVRSRSKPEGSIADGYLAEECLTFCSRFLSGHSVPKFRSYPENPEYQIGTRRNNNEKPFHLTESQWMECHRYNIFNFGNKDVENLIE